MKTQVNYENVKEAGNFSIAPPGVYRLAVLSTEDKKTRNGDPMILAKIQILNGVQAGTWFYHNVVLHKPDAKGAGFTKHFLRVISQPYEGTFGIDTDNWTGKEFIGRLAVDSYTNSEGATRTKNILEGSWHLDDKDAPALAVGEMPQQGKVLNGDTLEEVPF